ncbi:hypothetical protein TPA0907_40360 [Micromonospora humidisoli]|nr:hypothetical protein TPA0907_40360 [Micromonospora sp. AKA109]
MRLLVPARYRVALERLAVVVSATASAPSNRLRAGARERRRRVPTIRSARACVVVRVSGVAVRR